MAERVSARLPADVDLRLEYEDGSALLVLWDVKKDEPTLELARGTLRSIAVYLEAMRQTLDLLGNP